MMETFWEDAFREKQEMWGFQPARSALLARDIFIAQDIKKILIPGIGYGRNAKPFMDAGIHVTGIEISKTAIQLANKYYGNSLNIYQGSVAGMPFDQQQYDGIFCYGLIYLLDEQERSKLISDCYKTLSANGTMIFTAVTKEAPIYGQGSLISKDRYEMFGGVRIFFYDKESIEAEFGNAEFMEVTVVLENFPFYFITCKKRHLKTMNNKQLCE